jgi:hypothetical protein
MVNDSSHAPPSHEASEQWQGSEPAAFREVIAYLRGVADAVSAHDRAKLAAAVTEGPSAAVQLLRRTLPYCEPQMSAFEDEEFERPSGVRLRTAAPSVELCQLAGVRQGG